eukprot:gene24173-31423_t
MTKTHRDAEFPLLNCHSFFELSFHATRRVGASNSSELTSSLSPSISLLPSVSPTYPPSIDFSSSKDKKWFSVSSLIILHGRKFSTSKDVIRDAVLYSAVFTISDILDFKEMNSVSVFIKHSPDHTDMNIKNISAAKIAYLMQSWTNDKNVAIKVYDAVVYSQKNPWMLKVPMHVRGVREVTAVEVADVQMFSTSAIPPQYQHRHTLNDFTWVMVFVLLVIAITAVSLQVASEKGKLGSVLPRVQKLFRHAVHHGGQVIDAMKIWSSKISSQVSNSSAFRFNLASQEETDLPFSAASMKRRLGMVIMDSSGHHSIQNTSVHNNERLDEYMEDDDASFCSPPLSDCKEEPIIERIEDMSPMQRYRTPQVPNTEENRLPFGLSGVSLSRKSSGEIIPIGSGEDGEGGEDEDLEMSRGTSMSDGGTFCKEEMSRWLRDIS